MVGQIHDNFIIVNMCLDVYRFDSKRVLLSYPDEVILSAAKNNHEMYKKLRNPFKDNSE